MDSPQPIALALGGVALVVILGLRATRRGPGARRWGFGALNPTGREAARLACLAEYGTPQPPGGHAASAQGSFDSIGGTVRCKGCDADYPAGTLYCAACGSETVELDEHPSANSPPRTAETTTESHELVCVLVARTPVQAMLFKDYLESHHIACVLSSHVPSSVYHFSVTPLGEVRLMVRKYDAEQAELLLRECR